MALEPNPFKWSQNLKTLTQGVVLITTIIGSAWGAASYIGGKIYAFAEVQTTIVQQLHGVESQLTEAKNSIAAENRARDASLNGLKGDLAPRIDRLEGAVHDAQTEAAAAKQRVTDMTSDLADLKDLAHQNLRLSASHDDDIKATRRAVAPKPGDIPRGQ